MFRPSYLKEGPGIAKDAPEKTGAAWVGETLVREFWQLVKLNVLFLLCCLPVVTFGAARAAMARCTVNMARDVPNDVWTDFLAALRQDTVRNLLCGLAELALLWMGVMLVTGGRIFPGAAGYAAALRHSCVFSEFLGGAGSGGHLVCSGGEKCVVAVSAPSRHDCAGVGRKCAAADSGSAVFPAFSAVCAAVPVRSVRICLGHDRLVQLQTVSDSITGGIFL